ncbi:hypothetical protein NFI96_003572 [Prochilodus magdalenae]|nr:hypothetical protein NFI96_003572 [Prochilodus magdalenae]
MEKFSWTFCLGLLLAVDRTLGQTTNYTRPSAVDTGHCPQDAAHRTLPTGHHPQDAAPQDAAHRTLPHRMLPHRTLSAGWFWLVDDSQSSSDTEVSSSTAVSDPLTPAPPTLTHHHHVSITAVLRMIHHPHHNCSVVVHRETDGLRSGPVHLQSVLYVRSSLNSYTSFQTSIVLRRCLLTVEGWTEAPVDVLRAEPEWSWIKLSVPYIWPVFKCGGQLEGDSGFVGSEGFPSFYKPDSKCTWYITVPEGNVVMLSFRIFDLEADPLCRYDYVDVYNGHSNMVQKLGRFCGTFRPGALISTSNTMMLEMVSDSGTGGRGFLAYYNGGKPHVDEHQFCGGKLTKPQGTIKTPNWPEKNYPPGISCSWLITVDPSMVIEVKFDKFDVEQDTYCRFDYVVFFNGGEKDDSRLIGKYCGDGAPETIVSNSNVLLVQFVSDLSVTSDGFMASYSSIPRGSQPPTVGSGQSGGRVHSVPSNPRPAKPQKPITITTTKPPTTTTTTTIPTTTEAPPRRKPIPAKPKRPVRPPVRKPDSNQPRPARPVNPMCARACKRDETIKVSFCSSEFVITGTVTALSPGPEGSLYATMSIIKTYKAGRLTITQVGETMSVKLVLPCKNCPLLRRGQNFILMGQVDEEGRGTMAPGSFTATYKAPHHKILNNLNNQPCS